MSLARLSAAPAAYQFSHQLALSSPQYPPRRMPQRWAAAAWNDSEAKQDIIVDNHHYGRKL
jgi:hypothetical protein